MDKLYFLILFGASLLVFGQAQEEDLTVEFENPTDRFLEVGATDVSFTCKINRGPMWAMVNTPQFVRLNADGSETVLTSMGRPVEAEPSYYDVNVEQVDEGIAVKLDILEVRDLDDGKLFCRIIMDGADVREVSLQVWVLRPLEKLTLRFDSEGSYHESSNEPLTVNSGTYTIMCIAEGSNPGTEDVHLYIHGQKVDPSSNTMIQRLEDPVRKFRSVISADVEIGYMNSGHDVECTASSRAQDTHSVKVPIKVNVVDPDITCEEASAYRGEKYPEISCVVNHQNLDIEGFEFQLGDTGEIIEVGGQNEEFTTVTSEKIDDHQTKVILKLYKAEDKHFETDFYLVAKQTSGYISKSDAIRLKETEGYGQSSDPDGSSSLMVSSITLMLIVVCAVLQYL